MSRDRLAARKPSGMKKSLNERTEVLKIFTTIVSLYRIYFEKGRAHKSHLPKTKNNTVGEQLPPRLQK